jgi:hypothetical protein
VYPLFYSILTAALNTTRLHTHACIYRCPDNFCNPNTGNCYHEEICDPEGTKCTGKSSNITLVYTADPCSPVEHDQDTYGASCYDNGTLADTVVIKIKTDKGVNETYDVGVGDSIDINRVDGEYSIGNRVEYWVYVDDVLIQYGSFDVSCSKDESWGCGGKSGCKSCTQDLKLGDEFGSLKLASMTDKHTGEVSALCIECPTDCDDGNPCTTDACVLGTCKHVGETCDDSDPCTVDTIIQSASGTCTCKNEPKFCFDCDGCTIDYCDTTTGQCAHDLDTSIPGCCVTPPPPHCTSKPKSIELQYICPDTNGTCSEEHNDQVHATAAHVGTPYSGIRLRKPLSIFCCTIRNTTRLLLPK